MAKYRKFFLIPLTYILMLFFVAPVLGRAEETTSSSEDLPSFSYEVVHPDNQINESVGYYDLKMTPGQEQTVHIRFNNPSNFDVKVLVELSGAKTNSSGVIEYTNERIENDDSLKFAFEDIVTAPSEIEMAPGEEKILEINIKMPETSIEGYISGGIRLTRDGQVEEAGDSTVVNQVSYMVGMLLTEQEPAEIEAISEELQFNKVYPDIHNYRNAFMVNFSNIKSIYVNDVVVDIQISREGSSEVLYESKKSSMRMAPNSFIAYPVSLNGEQMVAGDYRAKIVVTSGKGGRWEWDEAFTVTDEEANKFNEQDLTLVQEPGINWRLVAMVAAGALGVLLVIFLTIHFVRKNRKAKNKARRNANRKSKKNKKPVEKTS